MIESHDHFDAQAELEALLRAAGNYVRPSDDLRPRVLENARAARGERRARRRLRGLLCTLLLCLVGSHVGDATRAQYSTLKPLPGQLPPSRIVSSDDFFRVSQTRPGHARADAAWGMLEAFDVLRSQQLKLFAPSM